MKIIEITGKMHSGKDYFAQELVSEMSHRGFSVWKTSFAWKLKQLVARHFGVTKAGFLPGYAEQTQSSHVLQASQFCDDIQDVYQDLYGEESPVIPTSAFTTVFVTLEKMIQGAISGSTGGRTILQNVGTEIVREHLKQSFWVDFVARAADRLSPAADFVVVSDMRFVNEGIDGSFKVKIIASDVKRALRSGVSLERLAEMAKHASEASIDEIEVDMVVDNSTDGVGFRWDLKSICDAKWEDQR